MTEGFKYLTSILLNNSIKSFSKISIEWFSPEEEEAYEYLRDYLGKNYRLPKVNTFIREFSHISIIKEDCEAKPEYYIESLLKRHTYTILATEIPKILRKAKADPTASKDLILDTLMNKSLTKASAKISEYGKDTISRFDKYEETEGTGGVTYLSSGISIMDEIMGGWSASSLYTIAGRSGIGKTFLLCYLILQIEEALQYGDYEEDFKSRPILLASNEMPVQEIKERLDCIRFGLPYGSFMKGTLDKSQKDRYFRGLKKLKSNIIIIPNVMTNQELESYLSFLRPSICFVDGSYLMNKNKKEATWERVQYTTQHLKEIANDTGTPIVNTTQLKRGSGKQENSYSFDAQEEFAFGGSFIQDSDVAISLYQDPNMSFRGEVGIQFAKGRRVDLENSGMIWTFSLSDMNFSIEKKEDIDIENPTEF